ncbi:MAG TPA: queuosine salvage family protein [Thermoanaerobaculaceae bacterium]|nr:queuosine salvage family protein [Thermoanaerobaculaceae bacterium]
MGQRVNFSQRVRAGCARVMAVAEHVQVRADRLADYARSLPLDMVATPQLDPAAHYFGSPENTAAFFLQLDAINFGSGYFPHLVKLPGRSGYFTVATHLATFFREHGPLTAEDLETLTPGDCSLIFRQDAPEPPITELMWLFSTALNDLGQLVQKRFAGSFGRMVVAAGGSSQELIGILIAMRLFRDTASYRGFEVPFLKRAQLAVADLALALAGNGLGRFRDLAELTIFADNLVPHVLRVDGLLEYVPELAARIDGGVLLAAGSPEEVEIRAAAVHAVELLRAELARQGRSVTAMQLDYLLWNRGQQPEYKARPRHRARTVFY